MSYTTLASVKISLGISSTAQDTILGQLITDAELYLNRALSIDSFDEATRTESIKFSQRNMDMYGNYIFYLKNFNVTAVSKINGTSYTGILGTDYLISLGRKVQIKSIYTYIGVMGFDNITIEYTAGYKRSPEALPGDVELIARLLVVGLYNERYPTGYSSTSSGQPSMQGVSSYSLGAESISRKNGANNLGVLSRKSPEERSMFDRLFMQYIKAKNAIR